MPIFDGMNLLETCDSLIFDMDGTLWDASDTYTAAWNEGLKSLKINKVMHRSALDAIMGWEKKPTLAHLLPEFSEAERENIHEAVVAAQTHLIRNRGGNLYPGVKEGLATLSKKYRLFILSNCPAHTIQHFMAWAGISEYITDEIAHGVNSMPKSHNIRLLMDKHGLQHPAYVGDTDGDRLQSERAGIPFVFVSYGFGKAERCQLQFDSFPELVNYFKVKS